MSTVSCEGELLTSPRDAQCVNPGLLFTYIHFSTEFNCQLPGITTHGNTAQRMKFRMRVQQVLFFCFVSAVWDGNTEEINIHKGNEGGDASVKCDFSFSNSTKFFCKGGCEDGNILIETTEDQAQRGRYSLKYGQVSVRNSFFLRVTITQLNKSDSGQYTCGLGETLSSSSFQKFEICVTGENHSSASSELSGWFTESRKKTATPTWL
ncbi:immunoglobulin mu Fc receptor-like isoform X2 [Channa argus]|uniref:immunoglobulin mu Fc receptor-like isoform X2 n=1 Tax=Channa argus TaxID=215402 RepID=UPI00352009E3